MEVLRFVVLGVAQNDHDIAAKIEGLRDADPKIRGHSAEILGDLHSAEAVPALGQHSFERYSRPPFRARNPSLLKL